VLRLKLALGPSAKVCKSIFLLKTVEVVAKNKSVRPGEWLEGDLEGRRVVFCGFSKFATTSSEIAPALSCSIYKKGKLGLEILGKNF
jgi:hypothetical protein